MKRRKSWSASDRLAKQRKEDSEKVKDDQNKRKGKSFELHRGKHYNPNQWENRCLYLQNMHQYLDEEENSSNGSYK